MRWFRRVTQLLLALAVLGLGSLLIGEATGAISGAWRSTLADGITELATEDPLRWAYTLAGVGLAAVALLLATAQLLPARKGMTIMLPVSDSDVGDTVLRGKALLAAVSHRVEDIVGVVDVETWLTAKAVTVQVRVNDRADVTLVGDTVRDRLDHGFWIDMGVADLSVNISIVHHPHPPRVR